MHGANIKKNDSREFVYSEKGWTYVPHNFIFP